MLDSKAVSGLATGQPWKRAFCSSPIADHVSFCTNKYSVVKKKDPVVCSSAAMMLSSPSVNTSMHTNLVVAKSGGIKRAASHRVDGQPHFRVFLS